jgi:hypothetical protein
MNDIKGLPHAEERQGARLEARTASVQLIFRCVNRFPDTLLRRDDIIGSDPCGYGSAHAV